MNWICAKATFAEAPDDWSSVHEVFARNGCAGTVEHDDPPAMSAYLCEYERSSTIVAALGRDLLDAGASDVDFSIVPEEDWAESWKQFFKPREIGKRFLIKPSWEDIGQTERIIIELDPGQAFGTGEHPTTRLCLCLLEEAVEPGDRVLDVGCGSGVLSVAAHAITGENVSATEIDPPAAEAARANFERNRSDVTLSVGDAIPSEWSGFDVVVSNIVSAVLIRLAPSVRAAIVVRGLWVLSGVIPSNWSDVLSAANANGFELITHREEEGWIAAVLRAAR